MRRMDPRISEELIKGIPSSQKPEEDEDPEEQGLTSVVCSNCGRKAQIEPPCTVTRKDGTYEVCVIRCPGSRTRRLAWKKFRGDCPVVIRERKLA